MKLGEPCRARTCDLLIKSLARQTEKPRKIRPMQTHAWNAMSAPRRIWPEGSAVRAPMKPGKDDVMDSQVDPVWAKNEIDRLREENARLAKELVFAQPLFSRREIEAQNAQMREALAFYVAGCDWQDPPPHCDRDPHMCCKTARAALPPPAQEDTP